MASTGFSSFTFDSWLKVKRAEKALRRQDNCTSLCVTEKVLCKCEAVCKLGLCCLETFTFSEAHREVNAAARIACRIILSSQGAFEVRRNVLNE